uniref:Ovule protein n=1 Tax=Mesocestoides corti TaxID=53468 RepID=A0A5K3G1C6_MESCO
HSRASVDTDVEYPSPNRKTSGTTQQALLTNHKPEPHVRCRPSESATLATLPIVSCSSFVSFCSWLRLRITAQKYLTTLASANLLSLCASVACKEDWQPTRERHE